MLSGATTIGVNTMIRNFLIIAFILSAVAGCDRNDKTMEQDKAEEVTVEQIQNEAGDMLDSVKDTAGDVVEGTNEMADDMSDASADAYDDTKDATTEMADDVSDASADAYDDTKDATKEIVDDIEQKMDDETK
jgi:gas vesicle protein